MHLVRCFCIRSYQASFTSEMLSKTSSILSISLKHAKLKLILVITLKLQTKRLTKWASHDKEINLSSNFRKEYTEAAFADVLQNRCSLKLCYISQENTCLPLCQPPLFLCQNLFLIKLQYGCSSWFESYLAHL